MNPYKILEVDKTATQEQIKFAYRSLCKKYHPDVVVDPALKKENEEKIKSINQAYDILSDEDKRKQYDNPPQQFNPFGGRNPFGGINIEELFGAGGSFFQHFGNMNGGQFSSQQIFNQNVKISVKQAILGGKLEISSKFGKLSIELPPGTQPNQTFTLRIKKEGNTEVFLQIAVEISIPTNLTIEQKKEIENISWL
jgi:curved DNA-binding protein